MREEEKNDEKELLFYRWEGDEPRKLLPHGFISCECGLRTSQADVHLNYAMFAAQIVTQSHTAYQLRIVLAFTFTTCKHIRFCEFIIFNHTCVILFASTTETENGIR